MEKWNLLTKDEQDAYMTRARYLIEYNYISDVDDIEALAIKMYKKKEGEI